MFAVAIAVLALAYILSHFYRSFLAVLAPQLEADLGIGPAELSDAVGAWFLAFGLAQFLVGTMLDRIGPRITSAALFLFGGAGGALWLSTAASKDEFYWAMVLLGAGCAPILMASLYLFKRTQPPARFALLASWFIGVGLLGNLLGSAPLAYAAQAYSWRAILVGLAGLTALLAVGIYLVVRDPPPAEGGGQGSYLELLKMPALWPIIPLAATLYAVPGGLRGAWIGPYLKDVTGLDPIALGNATFAMALALTIGSFVYGPLDRWLGTRKWIVVGGNLAVVACVALLAAIGGTAVTDVVLFTLIGFTGLGYAVLLAHGTANVPDRLAGRGVTLLNFFNIGGVGVFNAVTSRVYEGSGGGATGYHAVFWTYAIVLGAALAIYVVFSRDVPPDRT